MLEDKTISAYPELKTDIMARGLNRYTIDVVALCETRFPDYGQLPEKQRKYTFFWKGRPNN